MTQSSQVINIRRPSLLMLGMEPLRAAIELLSHVLSKAESSQAGDGHPVVIFPGLGGDGASVVPLKRFCRSLGYDAFDWGRGLNSGPKGDLDKWLSELTHDIGRLLVKNEKPPTLIGWSLGGLYAREVAKLMAPRVRQVITIGTPFNADADYSHAGWLFRLLSGSSTNLSPRLRKRLRTPPPVPTISIYSRSDGVVAWQSCRHVRGAKLASDIEVNGSHVGMGWNRSVLEAIAVRLAQPLHAPS